MIGGIPKKFVSKHLHVVYHLNFLFPSLKRFQIFSVVKEKIRSKMFILHCTTLLDRLNMSCEVL